ncbi:MAG: hypothetical protein LUD17_11290 [Bacteroidales bacterium]|nr:hypothetical protein [Bacteroidales bacterium]
MSYQDSNSPIGRPLGIAILVALVAVIVLLLWLILRPNLDQKSDADETGSNHIETTFEGIHVVSAPQLSKDGKSYDVTVRAKISDPDLEDQIVYCMAKMESQNGAFMNVPPSPTGKWTVEASIPGEEYIDPISLEISGFDPIEKSNDTVENPKVTLAEAQRWVADLIAGNNYGTNPLVLKQKSGKVSPYLKVSYTNLRSGEKAPALIDGVNKVKLGLWEGLKVVGIKCDPTTGLLANITMTIEYPEE